MKIVMLTLSTDGPREAATPRGRRGGAAAGAGAGCLLLASAGRSMAIGRPGGHR